MARETSPTSTRKFLNSNSVLPLMLSQISFPSIASLPPPMSSLRVSLLSVTFTALPVRKYLDHPLRMALYLQGSRSIHSRMVQASVRNGLATVSWGEGLSIAVNGLPGAAAVLRLELQAVGMFGRTTTLSFMSIDLASIVANVPAQCSVDFGFGRLTADVELQHRVNPLTTEA